MKITIDIIDKYNPCVDGILDFEHKYPNYNGTLDGILSMDNISYENKVWLATRVLDKMTLVQWSLDCATFVIDNFNKEFPNDNRVNETLKVVQQYILGEVDESAVESAAHSVYAAGLLTYSAAHSAAYSAARSADSATYSAYSAAYSVAYSVARSAELSAESAGKEQEDINLSLLIALI